MSQDKLLAWAESHKKGNTYSPYVCHIMNMLDKRVHNDCMWVSPYGFVPEASCEKHG